MSNMKSNSLINTTWNNSTVYALGLYKLITQSLGIWPLKCDDILSKIRLFVVILSQVVMISSLLSEINLDCGAVNDVIQMYSFASCNLLTLLKIFFMYFYKNNMFKVISSAVEDWQFITNPTILETMMKHAKLGRFVCIFQMISGYLSIFLMVLGTLPFVAPPIININDNTTLVYRPLPLRTVCFYGDMSTNIYLTIYFLEVFQLLVTCTANVGCDCYFFGITLHVAGQFEHLAYEYEHFCAHKDGKNDENLSELIAKHKKYLNFAEYLEETFSFILLFQLSANMIQMSLCGMQAIVSFRIGDYANVINIIVVYYVINLQIFLYSYAGDGLSTGIENLQSAIYFSPWYNLSPKVNKNLRFIMLRTSKSYSLTAGKIFDMNMDNYKNILKATFTYFSFLRAKIE